MTDQVASSTVHIDPSLFTVIIQFEVDAEDGEAFVGELTEVVGQTIVTLPGFCTAVFQLSDTHTRVINYAQWESKDIYDRSMSSIDSSDDHVGEVVARHKARVTHTDSYSVARTFSAES